MRNKTEYRDFGEYLVVRHGPERLAEGMRIFADDKKNSSAWMSNRQAHLEKQYPAFRSAADRLYEYQRNFLRTWGVATGLVPAESADAWADRWAYYVPLNRAVGDKGRAGARRGYANQDSTIRRARGSGLDIVHPVDNIINNTVRMVNAAMRNNVMATIAEAASTLPDTAQFLEQVPPPLNVTTYNVVNVKDNMRDAVHNAGMSDEDTAAVFDIINGLDDILKQYGTGKAHGDVVTVLIDGRPQFWKINDPLLLKSITNMNPASAGALLEAYGRVSRFMTSNITGRNVIWSMFSNFPRDFMTLMTYSKSKNVFKLAGGIASSYFNKLKGSKADPLYREYIAMGGGHTSAYTADKNLAKHVRKKLSGSRLQWLNPLEWLDYVSDAIEAGPRYSYYKLMRTTGEMTPQEAFYAAMDVTVNFRRGGSMSKQINKFIPFFNAGVQGQDKFARWLTADDAPQSARKTAVAKRVFAYVAVSAALGAIMWYINGDDEEKKRNYAQLSNYTKNNFWCIPLGDGEYFTIPKPREIGVLSSLFETLLERYANENENAFVEFYDYAADMFLPNAVNDLAKGDIGGAIGSLGILGVAAYMMANRDFLGKPIVSTGLESLEPKDQYNDRTSKIAVAIARAFSEAMPGISGALHMDSPQMIDYFFGQVLGGFWKSQKALFPIGGENVDLTLGVQGTYVRDNQYSTDLVNTLYDMKDGAEKAKNSDPTNMEKSVRFKWLNNMTTFYSRYSKLSKNVAKSTQSRATRQTVLNMIAEMNKSASSGQRTSLQEEVEQLCIKNNTTELMPSVMPDIIKQDGAAYPLTDSQYVAYQTEYNSLYWEFAGDALGNSKGMPSVTIVLAAKARAKEEATNRTLKRMHITTDSAREANAARAAGISDRDLVLWEAALDVVNPDGGNIKNEELFDALERMYWLNDRQRSFLFRTMRDSDKNNPYD